MELVSRVVNARWRSSCVGVCARSRACARVCLCSRVHVYKRDRNAVFVGGSGSCAKGVRSGGIDNASAEWLHAATAAVYTVNSALTSRVPCVQSEERTDGVDLIARGLIARGRQGTRSAHPALRVRIGDIYIC